MSGKSVANKINKAMLKVGKKIGFPSAVYRPDSYSEPIDDRNRIIDFLDVAWSVDEAFVKNPVDELAHYIVYVSGATVQLGDIIICEEQNTTLVITELDAIRIPAGIRADDRINLYRPEFVGGDKKNDLVLRGFEIPCAVKIGKAAAVGIANTDLKTGTTALDIWTWMPVDEVKMSDVIEWRGNRYLVASLNASSKGTKIHATSMKAGK